MKTDEIIQPYIYFGKRDGFEFFFKVPKGLPVNQIVGIIELDDYRIPIQPNSRILGIQKANINISTEKSIPFSFISIYEFSPDIYNRRGYHAFSVCFPSEKYQYNSKSILSILKKGLLESKKLKDNTLNNPLVINSTLNLTKKKNERESEKYLSPIFIPAADEDAHWQRILEIAANSDYSKIFSSISNEIQNQLHLEIKNFSEFNVDKPRKSHQIKTITEIYSKYFLEELSNYKTIQKKIKAIPLEVHDNVNELANFSQPTTEKTKDLDSIDTQTSRKSKENKLPDTSKPKIYKEEDFQKKSNIKDLEKEISYSSKGNNKLQKSNTSSRKKKKIWIPIILAIIVSAIYFNYNPIKDINNRLIKNNPPPPVEIPKPPSPKPIDSAPKEDPAPLEEESLTDNLLPADEVPLSPEQEQFIHESKVYLDVIQRQGERKRKNSYNLKNLNNRIDDLSKLKSTHDIKNLNDVLNELKKHREKYYGNGLSKEKYHIQEYQVKKLEDGEPESVHIVATKFGLKYHELAKLNKKDIIHIHDDVYRYPERNPYPKLYIRVEREKLPIGFGQ